MPAAKAGTKGGGRAKAAAARAETNGPETNGHVPKTLTFRGIDLILPDELGCEVAYAFADLEDAGQQVKPLLNFIESLLGHDQMAAVKAAQIRDKVTFAGLAEDLATLINDVYAQYGTEAGEA